MTRLLDAIKSAMGAEYTTAPADLVRSRRGTTNEARKVAIYVSRWLSGEILTAIGQAVDLHLYSSVSCAVCRMKRNMKANSNLRRRVKRLEHLFIKGQLQT